MDIKSDLQTLEIGFRYCQTGLTIEQAKLKYLNLMEKAINNNKSSLNLNKEKSDEK